MPPPSATPSSRPCPFHPNSEVLRRSQAGWKWLASGKSLLSTSFWVLRRAPSRGPRSSRITPREWFSLALAFNTSNLSPVRRACMCAAGGLRHGLGCQGVCYELQDVSRSSLELLCARFSCALALACSHLTYMRVLAAADTFIGRRWKAAGWGGGVLGVIGGLGGGGCRAWVCASG